MQEKEGKRRKYERGCCYIEREGEMGRKRKNKRGENLHEREIKEIKEDEE